MKKSARPASFASGVVMFCALAAFIGCAPPPKAPASEEGTALARSTTRELARLAEARELRDGRLAWCGYLNSLYQRGESTTVKWPGFDECVQTPTTGSASMLKATAECSMDALTTFEGNPFTKPEYAEIAGMCGAVALDQSSSSEQELAHLTSAICSQATACGVSTRNACAYRVEMSLGSHLEKVLGALNSNARTELSRCISHASCGDVADNITGCLEPIMDRLMYTHAVASNADSASPAPLAKY